MIHTVNPGERIKADDINLFVPYLETSPSDNVFGTNRGFILQRGSKIGSTKISNLLFKQVFETVIGDQQRVYIALGDNFNQAIQMLGVDRIYSVISGDVSLISDYNWYGHVDQTSIDPKEASSGYAMTKISSFTDKLYGYKVNGKIDGQSKQSYIISPLNAKDMLKELSSRSDIEDIYVSGSETIALKSRDSIQNVILNDIKDIYKQFDLTAFVLTKTVSSDEGDKKQYRWSADWYSHFSGQAGETLFDEYAVKFNDKDLDFKPLHYQSSILEGWNPISSDDEWKDHIEVRLSAYLNVSLGLIGYEDKSKSGNPNQWKYNENLTYYTVEPEKLSAEYWVTKGSVIPGSGGARSDCHLVAASYKIGEIFIKDDSVTIEQIFDGTQTFIAPYFDNSSGSGDLSGHANILVDSELSALSSCSLEEMDTKVSSLISVEIEIEGGETSVVLSTVVTDEKYYQIWQFDKLSNTISSIDLTLQYDVMLRHYDPDSGKQVEYYSLSNLILSGDSLTSSDMSSIVVDKNTISLFNFKDADSIQLGMKDVSSLTSDYKLLARFKDEDDKVSLKYVNLTAEISGSVTVSGDANYDDYEDDKSVSVNITSDGVKRVALYNFDKISTDDYYEFNGQDNMFLETYWNGHNTSLSAFNEDSWEEGQFLTRKRVSGQNQLRYSPIILRLPRYSLGDSNYGEMYKSISSWVSLDEPQYSLYNIGKDSDFKDLTISCDDIRDYYDYGYTGTESKIEDESNFKVLVRRYNQGVYYIDYVNLDSQIIPFVHGDGDEYDNTLKQYSIDSVPDYQNPDKTYYQLYKFDDGSYYDEIDVELLSDDYVNLATGSKSGEGSDEDYDFLVRHTNSNGTFLEYRHINVKGDGAGEGGQVIERIEHIEENITVISNDINDLSSQISGLSGDFWKKGGDCTDNYGSTIGDDNQTPKIDLNNNTLLGDWSTSDSFTTQQDLTCMGEGLFYNSIDVYDTVKSDKAEVTNTIKIGNTTLNEQQLQALLELIS